MTNRIPDFEHKAFRYNFMVYKETLFNGFTSFEIQAVHNETGVSSSITNLNFIISYIIEPVIGNNAPVEESHLEVSWSTADKLQNEFKTFCENSINITRLSIACNKDRAEGEWRSNGE